MLANYMLKNAFSTLFEVVVNEEETITCLEIFTNLACQWKIQREIVVNDNL